MCLQARSDGPAIRRPAATPAATALRDALLIVPGCVVRPMLCAPTCRSISAARVDGLLTAHPTLQQVSGASEAVLEPMLGKAAAARCALSQHS